MKTIKLISWNVNGIRAAYKKGIVDWINTEQPDILCLQETKAQIEQLPKTLINIDGYNSYFESAERKGYSGVAIYTKINPENIVNGFGKKKFDIEGRVLQADYKKFSLFNVYFPNGKAKPERLKYKMDFYDAFLKHINKLKKASNNIVVCGDVNTAHKEIDLARPKQNEKISGFLPEERAWMDKLIKNGYLDTFRMFSDEAEKYTWWDMKSRARDRNVGWRIDYFYVSESIQKMVKSAKILSDVMGSDHCPISLELNL